MVEIGACTTNVAAYCNGELRHIAVLPFGGATVTNDLVRGLSVPFAEAKRAKEHFGAAFAHSWIPARRWNWPGPGPGQKRHVARELIAHVVEQRLDEMFGLVHAELEREGLLNKLGAGVVLTGGASTLYGTVELAQHVSPPRYAAACRARAWRVWPTPWEGRSSPRLRDSRFMAPTGTRKPGTAPHTHFRPCVQGRFVAEGIFLVLRRTNDSGHPL